LADSWLSPGSWELVDRRYHRNPLLAELKCKGLNPQSNCLRKIEKQKI
jgi:hypothetical protein